jgi:hypothetical protein
VQPSQEHSGIGLDRGFDRQVQTGPPPAGGACIAKLNNQPALVQGSARPRVQRGRRRSKRPPGDAAGRRSTTANCRRRSRRSCPTPPSGSRPRWSTGRRR